MCLHREIGWRVVGEGTAVLVWEVVDELTDVVQELAAVLHREVVWLE